MIGVLLLAATALALVSCDGKSATGGNAGTTTSQTAEQQSIDGYLLEFDRSIDSVGDSDFNETQLSDPELGL